MKVRDDEDIVVSLKITIEQPGCKVDFKPTLRKTPQISASAAAERDGQLCLPFCPPLPHVKLERQAYDTVVKLAKKPSKTGLRAQKRMNL